MSIRSISAPLRRAGKREIHFLRHHGWPRGALCGVRIPAQAQRQAIDLNDPDLCDFCRELDEKNKKDTPGRLVPEAYVFRP